MTKGYIFDYGGTLDTGGCHWGRLIGHAYEQCGVGIDNQLFREAYVYAERELAKQPIIQPHYSFRQTLATKLQIELEYIHRCHPELHVKDKHEALLNTLYATTQKETAQSKRVLEQLKVNYPLVLVSNFYGNIHTVLREYGMDHLFDKVIESAVVGVRKPDARIFTLGVDALALQPHEVVVVGDSYDKDIVAAKNAGCQTVWIKGEGWTDEEIDAQAADHVITSIEQVIELNC